jgi:hypothetical protein
MLLRKYIDSQAAVHDKQCAVTLRIQALGRNYIEQLSGACLTRTISLRKLTLLLGVPVLLLLLRRTAGVSKEVC